MDGATSPPSGTSTNVAGHGRLASALPLLALVVVAVFATRRLDDWDTWWHLAAGRWIVEQRAIPSTDVLSFTATTSRWVNLQWLYDVLLYGAWSVGGATAVVAAAAASFTAAFAVLAVHLRRHVGPIAAAALLLWVATMVNERFLARPEMASFLLLAVVQWLLATGRDEPSRLRWLVPVMAAWANLHSLFILGAGAVACAMAGALACETPLLPAAWRRDGAWPPRSRRALLLWGGASLLATLANPWLAEGVLFPLGLMSRLDGSMDAYAAIGEFRSPFASGFETLAIRSYKAFLVAAGAVAAAAAALRAFAPGDRANPSRGGFDVGAFAFAAALAWLSVLARRNVGVFAVGALPFVAACIAVLSGSAPRLRSTAARAVATRTAVAATAGAALVVAALAASNRWYAATGEAHETGLGVFESNFPVRAASFVREQGVPGPMYNDDASGGYLAWTNPTGKGVYVDGRLEVYETEFFAAYMRGLSDPRAWMADADARGIQSALVFHHWGNRFGLVRALLASPAWRPVYYDEAAIVFVRVAGNEAVVRDASGAFASTWRARTEDALAAPGRTWAWQRSVDRYTGRLTYAVLLGTLRDPAGALRWLESAIALGLPRPFEVDARQRAAEHLAVLGRLAEARLQLDKAAAADPANAETRRMLDRLGALEARGAGAR